jgi:DNA-binding winged helix-turn-helix (wHTH) protein
MIELNFPNPITHEKDLFGHEADLDRIERVFLAGKRIPVVILGEHYTGKTSTMNVLLRRLDAAEGRRFVPLFVPAREVRTFEGFARAILQRLSAHLGKGLSAAGPLDVHLFETVFSTLLDPQPKETFLICVDDFDVIIYSADETETRRMDGLIHHLTGGTRLPLAFLFTMTRFLPALLKSYPSPFTSTAEIVELVSFEEARVAEMLRGLLQEQVVLADSGLERLFELSGGHPYFVKLLLANLLERHGVRQSTLEVTPAMLEQALQDAVDDPRANSAIENIYEVHLTDQEREVILLLAGRQGHIHKHELKTAGLRWVTAARSLVRRGYLTEQEEGFDFCIAFLRYWLCNWARFDEECETLSELRGRLAEPAEPAEVEVNEMTGQVRVKGHPVKLSPMQYQVLLCLARRAGQIVARQDLVESAWGVGAGVSEEAVDRMISGLRKQLGSKEYIKTHHGRGFELRRAVRISGENGEHN